MVGLLRAPDPRALTTCTSDPRFGSIVRDRRGARLGVELAGGLIVLGGMGADWKSRLLHVFLPRVCAACRLDLAPAAPEPVCRECLGGLAPLGRCLRTPGNLEVWAAFAYRHPVPELLHAFKYRGRPWLGRFLGDAMARFAVRAPLGGIDAVVPVPLHRARLRERGFNQAAILAEAVAAAVRAPVAEALERARNTAPQWRLDRASRAANLRDAFRVSPQAGLGPGRGGDPPRLLLVDDVCTTGGTLDGCARTLRLGGCGEVRALVLAQD